MNPPRTPAELEDALSSPSPAAIDALRAFPGDVVVLGAGGKMGPSLAVMVRRAADAAGTPRRVIAVSRFTNPAVATHLGQRGVDVLRADLSDPSTWDRLPDAPLVVFMAGQKFGTEDAPFRTWHTNVAVPAFAASRYRRSRIVAFSTGNVYPLVPVAGNGSREGDPLAPVGEYAQSCLGRERLFEHAAATWGTPVTLIRLNYAVDLRYGVLVDLAVALRDGRPIDVTMGHVNCIWQGDANALALASFLDAASPATASNLTGARVLSVREAATQLAARLGVSPRFSGEEASTALLSDARPLIARHGPLRVDEHTLIDWVAAWVAAGNPTSGKPTRFEQREGRF